MEHFQTEWGGRTLSIEVGKYANQANGSCVVRYGDTVVLGTAGLSENKREGIDFFPLMVDYEEKYYAAGKIKGSRFIKREGRPSDQATLTSRMIDRALRPLFNQEMRNDVQIISTVLSADLENSADIPAFIAASCALYISDIPWNGPVGCIRVGYIPSDEDPTRAEWMINPTLSARQKSTLDLVIAGTSDRLIMVESGANEIPEDLMEEAFAFGQKHLKEVVDLMEEIRAKIGKAKQPPLEASTDEEVRAKSEQKTILEDAKAFLIPKIKKVFFNAPKASKAERKQTRKELTETLDAYLVEKQIGKEKRTPALNAIYEIVENEVSRAILEENKRIDGRGVDEIRTLITEAGVLPRTHGSAHFSRGETQVLSTVTLGAPSLEQTIDTMEEDVKKHYMHHYYCPSFSVGEVKPNRGVGRREIGHGALAERALIPVLPERETFPYAIRVVSEVFSSNGSSSMASSCGSTLALMDAGVPIKKPVAGIAMGLASGPNDAYKIITDIQDLEDGPGGMDFKIAGTRDGITAMQMDTKTHGLTPAMIKETLTKAHAARLKIIDAIEKAIPAPRAELSPFAPRIITVQINPDRIRDVIGPGGKIINEIIDATGAEIDIEQTGLIFITSVSAESAERAVKWINDLTREIKAGEVFENGKVTRLMDFGAFVEVLPNKEGMVHISELAPFHVRAVTDVLKVGDIIPVKVIEIDDMGRVNLSLKQAPGYSIEKYGNGADKFSGQERPPSSGFEGRGQRPEQRRPGGGFRRGR